MRAMRMKFDGKGWLRGGVRAVAVFEAAKGLLVLVAGLGLLDLLHGNVQAAAERLVRFSHLNPASKYPQIFLEAAAHTTDARLLWLAAGAGAYAAVRFAEAYGLWHGRVWAEWLALVAGGLYVPVELYHIWLQCTALKVVVLAVNLAVVGYMAYALRRRKERPAEAAG